MASNQKQAISLHHPILSLPFADLEIRSQRNIYTNRTDTSDFNEMVWTGWDEMVTSPISLGNSINKNTHHPSTPSISASKYPASLA
ncbi:MAG: hypothetical protein IPO92_18865 [Saprospiraceae bacterium]|nr:hypothetical protein [Saprospiraceae bacterium]